MRRTVCEGKAEKNTDRKKKESLEILRILTLYLLSLRKRYLVVVAIKECFLRRKE